MAKDPSLSYYLPRVEGKTGSIVSQRYYCLVEELNSFHHVQLVRR